MRTYWICALLLTAACGGDAQRDAQPGDVPAGSAEMADSTARGISDSDEGTAYIDGGAGGTTADGGTATGAAGDVFAGDGSAPAAGGIPSRASVPVSASPSQAGGTAGQAGAPVQEDVAAALRRASAAYEELRSLRAEFVMHMRNDLLRQNSTSRGTLYQRSPDRIAVRFSDPAGDVIVGDGQWFHAYYPSVDPKQSMRMPAAGADVGGVDLKAQFVGNPLERFEATSHGTESVGGRPASVITLEPRRRAEYRSLKVWIDTRDGLARRFEILEHNGTLRRFDLSSMQTNIAIPDATFQFTPPAGVQVVTSG